MSQTSPSFVTTGAYPTRSGNQVTPWIDGEPAFRRICEAMEAARHSVWATVTFMWPTFEMPDGRGSTLDVLQRIAKRGVDVRVIFWRPGEEMVHHRRNAFWGSEEHFKALARRHPHVKIRWDSAAPRYCQHQKTWLIDAGRDTATSFVGGINLNPHSLVAPGHSGQGHNHDVYVEVAGPAVADVQHNFTQRWNEASERNRRDGAWGEGCEDELVFPRHTPCERGAAVVQIQRTTHAGRYAVGHAAADGSPFDVAAGEKTNLKQYCAAIRSARRTVYIENQYIEVADIVAALHATLARGVQVVLLLPAVPDLPSSITATPERLAFLDVRADLARHDNFTVSGIAGVDAEGCRNPVYVHAKLMLIDDEWATVGSCNLHHHSLHGNGELNAAFLDPLAVRAMRVALFREHLGVDTADVDDVEAHLLFRRIALDNRQRYERGDSRWQGLAFSLNMQTYGQQAQF